MSNSMPAPGSKIWISSNGTFASIPSPETLRFWLVGKFRLAKSLDDVQRASDAALIHHKQYKHKSTNIFRLRFWLNFDGMGLLERSTTMRQSDYDDWACFSIIRHHSTQFAPSLQSTSAKFCQQVMLQLVIWWFHILQWTVDWTPLPYLLSFATEGRFFETSNEFSIESAWPHTIIPWLRYAWHFMIMIRNSFHLQNNIMFSVDTSPVCFESTIYSSFM